MVCTRHMFEVEQIDYDKEQIDWSYITFNDNKVRHFLIIQIIKSYKTYKTFKTYKSYKKNK